MPEADLCRLALWRYQNIFLLFYTSDRHAGGLCLWRINMCHIKAGNLSCTYRGVWCSIHVFRRHMNRKWFAGRTDLLPGFPASLPRRLHSPISGYVWCFHVPRYHLRVGIFAPWGASINPGRDPRLQGCCKSHAANEMSTQRQFNHINTVTSFIL